MHLLIIGGSDAGISAALRSRELDAGVEVTLALADNYPNFSICGLPYYISGETPDRRGLAHRTEFLGINVLRGHAAESIDCANKKVQVRSETGEEVFRYDQLIIATRATPIRPALPGKRGIRVTLLSRSETVLPTIDAALCQMVRQELHSNGVYVLTGISAVGVEQSREGHDSASWSPPVGVALRTW